jgi:hypothetical protein
MISCVSGTRAHGAGSQTFRSNTCSGVASGPTADLIVGIPLGLTAIGELLGKLHLTPQKPLQRAYQRDPEAIQRWQRETYPAIARQAKAEGGEVF